MSTFTCFIMVWFALQSGCMPDFGASASLLDSPRILAVRSEPAEVYPGESVRLMVYATDGGGMIALPPVSGLSAKSPNRPLKTMSLASAVRAMRSVRFLDKSWWLLPAFRVMPARCSVQSCLLPRVVSPLCVRVILMEREGSISRCG